MKQPLVIRVALFLAVSGLAAAALVGGRVATSGQAHTAKPAGKTEVVALEVARRVPAARHSRCRIAPV